MARVGSRARILCSTVAASTRRSDRSDVRTMKCILLTLVASRAADCEKRVFQHRDCALTEQASLSVEVSGLGITTMTVGADS